MTDFTIRPAAAEDVPVVLRMIRALAVYEHLDHEVVVTEPALRESLFGERPAAQAVLAWSGSGPIGFAVWFMNYSTFLGRQGLYLEDLFVLPEWRGRGVGRALLSHLARIAVAGGHGRLEWSVLDWNTSAIRFYRGVGAQAMDQWTVYRLTGDALTKLAEAGALPA